MKKHNSSRVIALLLTMAMMVGIFPTAALAEHAPMKAAVGLVGAANELEVPPPPARRQKFHLCQWMATMSS